MEGSDLGIVTGSASSFPRIRILHEDVGKILLQRVEIAVFRSGMVSFPTWVDFSWAYPLHLF